MRTSPHVAVVTCFWPDHLELHGSLMAYRRAKEQIVRAQTADDHVVVNADDPQARGLRRPDAGHGAPVLGARACRARRLRRSRSRPGRTGGERSISVARSPARAARPCSPPRPPSSQRASMPTTSSASSQGSSRLPAVRAWSVASAGRPWSTTAWRRLRRRPGRRCASTATARSSRSSEVTSRSRAGQFTLRRRSSVSSSLRSTRSCVWRGSSSASARQA